MHRILSAIVGVGLAMAPTAAIASTHAPHNHARADVARTFRVPVLEYHRFLAGATEVRAHRGYDVTPATFDAQLTALEQAGWHTITAAQLAQDVQAGIEPPARSFVITIDDGYSDGSTEALPILQRHGMVATYFVIAGRIGERRGPDAVSLTEQQIRDLAAAGMEIGNHTAHHARLGTLSAAEQAAEIGDASTRIEAITGKRPVTMAYPFGSFNADTAAAAERSGILLAFDSHTSVLESVADRYSVPRLRIGPAMTGAELVALLAHT